MKVLCLSTLFTLFLRGRSFSNHRALQKLSPAGNVERTRFQNVDRLSRRSSLSMHMGHSHTHDHHDDDDDQMDMLRKGPELSFSLWGQLMRPKETLLHRPQGKVFLAALLILIPALIRKRFRKLDFGIFAVTAVALSVFDSARFAVKKYMSKIKMFQETMVKHSTPMTRKYFFKNDNAADRITLAGVYINIILSVAKFCGGIGKTTRFDHAAHEELDEFIAPEIKSDTSRDVDSNDKFQSTVDIKASFLCTLQSCHGKKLSLIFH